MAAFLGAPRPCFGRTSDVGHAGHFAVPSERFRMPLTRSLRLLCRSGEWLCGAYHCRRIHNCMPPTCSRHMHPILHDRKCKHPFRRCCICSPVLCIFDNSGQRRSGSRGERAEPRQQQWWPSAAAVDLSPQRRAEPPWHSAEKPDGEAKVLEMQRHPIAVCCSCARHHSLASLRRCGVSRSVFLPNQEVSGSAIRAGTAVAGAADWGARRDRHELHADRRR